MLRAMMCPTNVRRGVATAAILVLAGCGTRDVTASVTIDGVPAAVRTVGPSAQRERDGFIVRLVDDRVLYVDFPREVPALLGVAQEADGSDGFRAGLAQNGSPLVDLCTSNSSTEGSFDLRDTHRSTTGFLDHVDGTLRVRFVGCVATYQGEPQADLEFVIELPREM